jgi:hypothetical protein
VSPIGLALAWFWLNQSCRYCLAIHRSSEDVKREWRNNLRCSKGWHYTL